MNPSQEKNSETKISPCSDKPAGIYDKKVPKVGSNYTCLTVLLLDSVLKKDKNYYPQLLSEWKHTEKEKKVFRHITDDSGNFSVESDG